MLVELLRTLLAWALLLPVSFSVGALLFRRWVPAEENRLLRGILFYALGLATLSYGVVFLGLFRALYPPILWIFLMALLLLSVGVLKEWVEWLKLAASRFSWSGKSGRFRILTTLFFISLLALFMGTLTPEIGGDALCYQLNLPKVFLAQHSLAPNDYDYNSFFPLLMNNLFLIGLATGGVLSAKLFHFLSGLLLFLSVNETVRSETRNDTLAFFIALVLWLTPTVYNLLSSAYIDVGLAFYTFLAVFTFLEALENQNRKLFLLSGILLGCAVSVKYLGLVSVVGLAIVGEVAALNLRALGSKLSGFALWLAGLAAVPGYWLLRNWVATGNPFFPYFGSLFHLYHRPPMPFDAYGYGRGLLDFISVLWNMFISPADFGTAPTRIGVFYFLFLPFVLLAPFFAPRSRGYFLFTLFSFVLWFRIAQADRWLLPVLPVMGVTAGFGMQGFYDRASASLKSILKGGGGMLGIVLLVLYLAGGVYHYRYSYLLFLGRWSWEDYLKKMERTFPVASWINGNLPLRAKILLESEPRQFYFDRPTIRDVFLKWRLHYEELGWAPEDLAGFLHSLGVTHLLINDPVPAVTPQEQSLVRALAKSPLASEVKVVASENIRDEKFLYRLYELKPA